MQCQPSSAKVDVEAACGLFKDVTITAMYTLTRRELLYVLIRIIEPYEDGRFLDKKTLAGNPCLCVM